MRILSIFVLILILLFLSGCVSPSESTSTSQSPSPQPPMITPESSPIPPSVQPSPPVSSSGNVTVSYIDVGQGDSELVRSPSGNDMLIDAGPTTASSAVVSYLQQEGISRVDIVVVTHPHEDHYGGMTAVLNTFPVGEFLNCGYPANASGYQAVLALAAKDGAPPQAVKAGDTISFDPTVSVQVLSPSTLTGSDLNQDSVVLKMTYGNVIWLFTGDGGEPVENQYAHAAGHIDILKAAHHGSCTSSYASFLLTVHPEVSVISVGANNPYGHPCAATISRLQQFGSKVYRTNLDGTITITSDGQTYSVRTEKAPPAGGVSQPQGTVSVVSTPTTAPTVTVAPPCTVNYETGTCPVGKCWVRDYCRADGTHVNGYCRRC